MLHARALLENSDFALSEVRCTHRRGHRTSGEVASAHAVVFVRRGHFVRSVDDRQYSSVR